MNYIVNEDNQEIMVVGDPHSYMRTKYNNSFYKIMTLIEESERENKKLLIKTLIDKMNSLNVPREDHTDLLSAVSFFRSQAKRLPKQPTPVI
jgi:hypothetical protein